MRFNEQILSRPQPSGVVVNRVLRNTYILLSMTLLFCAGVAAVSASLNWPHPGLILTLVGYFGLLFLTSAMRNSGLGIVCVFALTGFMGLTLGPIIGHYITAVPNGDQIVMTAFGGTGLIFLGLSAYALTTRKNFAFLGGMLFAGILAAFVMSLVAIFFNIPALSIAISGIFIILMSGLILYQTSAIVHGGETNYIMATVTLFISIYNLFLSLIQILSIFGGRE